MGPNTVESQTRSPDHLPIQIHALDHLSFNQQVLCYAGLKGENEAVINFTINSDGVREIKNYALPEQNADVIKKFREDPKEFLGTCRQNLMRIKLDERLTQEEKTARFNRYLNAYLLLSLKLDHAAFPPSDTLYRGVPEYIPDGLSDWGSNDAVDPARRNREKIRVDKKQVFDQAKPLLQRLFNLHLLDRFGKRIYSDEQIKEMIVQEVARYVYNLVNYDWGDTAHRNDRQSIKLSDVAEKRLGVCRHQALYTQILLQAFGISSRLFKSELIIDNKSLGPHANNLVRIQGKWHVLDVTNPERFTTPEGAQSARVFLKTVSETHIDLNNKYKSYFWEFTEGNGHKQAYRSRNDMYYKIVDNTKRS